MSTSTLNVEDAVRARYSKAAEEREPALCCPVTYDPKLLEAIPAEVKERDYGCGNPAPYLRRGETVLDLGSGSGKIAFIASQVVGPEGRVIGVDMNDDMLALARRSIGEFAKNVGYANVEFKKGRIQDLALDLGRIDARLVERPVRSALDLGELETEMARLRRELPLIPSESIDVVVSNCVLNLVRPEDKLGLFKEIHRVLKRGGRAVISDIVCDEDVPEHLMADAELWSGCISGALREDHFLEAFENAGLYGVTLLERDDKPWRTVEGIELRSVVVAAYKGKEGPCLDQKHAVIYKGPFHTVKDDDGHILRRGVRSAVCAKTFDIYMREPYRAHFEAVLPLTLVPLDEAPQFAAAACTGDAVLRHPRETKGLDYNVTTEASAGACAPGADGKASCC